MSQKTILTGLQANSTFHIGNYVGAILPMINAQKNLGADDMFLMFVPDLHSFTLPINHANFYQQILDNVKIYLAAGINPGLSNTLLYRQSFVPAHSELAWILSCFSYMGEMGRMTQYKDKSEKHDNISVGLFTYPILMAADILLYGAQYIPLGDDQKQHIEIARDIAIRMNNKFELQAPNGLFTLPKPWKEQLDFMGVSEGIRIRSLSNPEKKMSKSTIDPKGTILLSDTPQDAAKKIMSAQTDTIGEIHWDWENQPGVTNLLQLYYLFGIETREEAINYWTGKTRYGDLKKEVADKIETFLIDMQAKTRVIQDKEVETILINGELQANLISKKTLNRVQKVLGLRR
ncbi:MAG: tryptophan--tRNA ligase [candidate division SR1 bacterium]|nr:tryptophan--tRNA ligase [candidate division SR1 bacterium]